MRTIRIIIAVIAAAVAFSCPAMAQTSPNFSFRQVPTPAQWNVLFAGKQDYLGAPPILTTGGTLTGPLITLASTAVAAGLNLPPGAAPTSPNNGDFWSTSVGFYGRVNGATVGPFAAGTSGSFTATSPLVVTFPGGGVVNYALNLAVANAFLAQQTNQGATTTQPGWYAQLTGDTFARVRVGLNSTDIASLAFGPGNAARDLLLERAGPAALRFGSPDATAPVAQTLSVQNVVTGTNNTAGVTLTIDGSQGTGTGLGGDILFKTAPAGSTGSAQNAVVTSLHLYGSGGIAMGASATDPGVGNLNLGGGALWNNGTAPTGTGAYVRASSPSLTSPVLTTPNLGVATAISIDNVAITAPGSLATLTLASGKTITVNNSLTLTGTDGTTMTFPASSATLAGLGIAETFSANQTFSGQAIHTATSVPTSASGNTNIAGTLSAVPTLSNTGQANLFNTTVGGAIVQGDGSTDDFRIYNKSGGLALNLPTGTTVPQLPGLASGTCVNGLGLDSSNNIVKDACPGAASSIQQGAGGTTITSANGTGRLLTEGAVSGGTGLLTDVPATIDSSGNLASVNSIAGSVIATKAQQQSASAANLIVTPSQQQSHDSAAKATCLFNGTTPGTNACLGGVSFNVTNLTRNSAGNYTANFTTPFATFVSSIPTFGCVAYPLSNAGNYTSEGLTPTVPGTFNFLNLAAGVATDVSLEMLVCYGRQ